jgi:hypothetical protein
VTGLEHYLFGVITGCAIGACWLLTRIANALDELVKQGRRR